MSDSRGMSMKDLEERGFKITHCGWMRFGYIEVSGPPATSNIRDWSWFIDDQPLPKLLWPKTKQQLLWLCDFVSRMAVT